MQRSAERPQRRHRVKRYSAFTLFDMTAAVAASLSITLLGLPLYNTLKERGPEPLLLEDSLQSQLEYARQEAVRLETVVTICPSRDGRNCEEGGDWQQGWLIFTDAFKPSRHFSVGDRLLHQQPALARKQPTLTAMDMIQYQADGSIRLD